MAVHARPAVRAVPRVTVKPTTIKPLPKASVGKPIVKNDTHVATPKAEAAKTTTANNSILKSNALGAPTVIHSRSGFNFSDYLFYRWLLGDNHPKDTPAKEQHISTQEPGSFAEEKENNVFASLSLWLIVTALIIAVAVWWHRSSKEKM